VGAAMVGVGTAVVGGDDTPGYAAALAEVLDRPDGRLLTLEPGASGAEGEVRVAWSAADGRAVLLADGLTAAPDGAGYELWLIEAGGPVPMEVLDPADDGEIREVLDIEGAPVAWGVTIEPEGGSPAPTGEILYVAEA
jgi:anti-sigma-K factor RskA